MCSGVLSPDDHMILDRQKSFLRTTNWKQQADAKVNKGERCFQVCLSIDIQEGLETKSVMRSNKRGHCLLLKVLCSSRRNEVAESMAVILVHNSRLQMCEYGGR